MALLVRSRDLQQKMDLQSALASSKSRGDSANRVNDWKEEANLLGHHINAQMDYCKQLRDSSTLQSLLSDDPDVAETKVYRNRLATLKADIRALHDEYCSRALGMHDVMHAGAADARKAAQWQQRTHQVERVLADSKLEEAEISASSLLQLDALRHDLLVDVYDYMLQKKNALDSTLGLNTDALKRVETGTSELPVSKDVRALLHVVEAFLDLEGLIRQAGMTSDGVKHARTIARLERQKAEMEGLLADRKHAIGELQETVAILRGTAGDRPSGAQTLKIDEAVSRMRELERELSHVRAEHAKNATRCGMLQDTVAKLRAAALETKKRHQVETGWYAPRVQELSESVALTQKTMEKMQLDVELLAAMYKTGCEELDAMAVQVEEAHKERQIMSKKVHAEIQKMVWCQQELKRKDDIAIRLNAARLSALEAYEKANAITEAKRRSAQNLHTRVSALEEQLESTNNALKTTQSQLRDANHTIEDLREEQAKSEPRYQELLAEKQAVEEELRHMEKRVVEVGLDDASVNRFKRMKEDLDNGTRIHAALEADLKDKAGRIKQLQRTIQTLRSAMSEAGLDPDEALM